MKKNIFIITLLTVMSGVLFSNCQSSANKVERAEDKVHDAKVAVVEAQIDLNVARQDSITEYQKFKDETDAQISAYDKSIAEFRTRLATERKENRARYEKMVLDLEQRNRDLKKKLAEYQDDGKTDWEKFKTEFNHDMDELGKSFKDFNTNNVN
ncbi:MAG: hypothetical protein HOO86_14715 [Bacteroidales bacterium]|nr:hypothetical protein [Bacteroidales bacterium]